jgi:hypothetical protein
VPPLGGSTSFGSIGGLLSPPDAVRHPGAARSNGSCSTLNRGLCIAQPCRSSERLPKTRELIV